MADEITVGGITVPLTHPGKVLFPADGITKADLARYYADAADRMLPWLRDRPITMVRYPDGLDGQRFFQKNAPSYFPDWIRRVRVGKEGGEVEHAVCDKPHPTRWSSTSIPRTPNGSPTSGGPRCGRVTCWTANSA
jgi:bifunctional non-homologous end joining protein LigD